MDPAADVIHWPAEFDPRRAPIHVRNELAASASASNVWAWLVRARDWPSWYPNSQTVRLEGGVSTLGAGMTFRWRTFGVSLVSRVKEFVPEERIAWTAKGIGVWAYHAWLVLPAAAGGCTIITEETQYGLLSRLGARFMPSRMHRLHQVWLENLAQKARRGLPDA